MNNIPNYRQPNLPLKDLSFIQKGNGPKSFSHFQIEDDKQGLKTPRELNLKTKQDFALKSNENPESFRKFVKSPKSIQSQHQIPSNIAEPASDLSSPRKRIILKSKRPGTSLQSLQISQQENMNGKESKEITDLTSSLLTGSTSARFRPGTQGNSLLLQDDLPLSPNSFRSFNGSLSTRMSSPRKLDLLSESDSPQKIVSPKLQIPSGSSFNFQQTQAPSQSPRKLNVVVIKKKKQNEKKPFQSIKGPVFGKPPQVNPSQKKPVMHFGAKKNEQVNYLSSGQAVSEGKKSSTPRGILKSTQTPTSNFRSLETIHQVAKTEMTQIEEETSINLIEEVDQNMRTSPTKNLLLGSLEVDAEVAPMSSSSSSHPSPRHESSKSSSHEGFGFLKKSRDFTSPSTLKRKPIKMATVANIQTENWKLGELSFKKSLAWDEQEKEEDPMLESLRHIKTEDDVRKEKFNIFKESSVNFFEFNQDNFLVNANNLQSIKDLIKTNQKEKKKTEIKKDATARIVSYNDAQRTVTIHPKYMEFYGTMCFTELWSAKSKWILRNVRKEQAEFVKQDAKSEIQAIYRPQKHKEKGIVSARMEANKQRNDQFPTRNHEAFGFVVDGEKANEEAKMNKKKSKGELEERSIPTSRSTFRTFSLPAVF